MTGTLQALSFSPRPARTLPYRRRHAHFPATHVDLLSGHTFYSKPSPLLLRKPYSIPGPIRVANHSDQVNGDGNRAPRVPDSATASNWMRNLSTFASDNFLPLALVGGVLFGLANPSLGCLADRYYVSKLSTFGIFIISGLTLRSDEIGAAAEAWPVGIFGLGSILLFTPFFSRLILQLQLQPQEFVTGLAIFSCMPTTLSSGVALTRLAGGNSALALAMTVISNLLGILIVCRESSKGLAAFVDQNRKLLSMISALLLGLVPWIQVSRSSSLLLMVKPAIFLVAVGMGALLHLILLAFNALAIQGLLAVSGGSKSVFAKRENVTALLLVASQKTLPVMAAVVEQLGGALGESGLLILPCVAAHLNQIIMDSFFVNFWLQNEQSSNQAKVA
ncbi:probable sodium/metabolite cotransporter BASS4, chloroplastic isoform X2 [Actinidia eriantha]|uniref:probable sodium/metabolite cotransporter BASS4, chloroplastic isoform X2 n=1 Tax=Actinidia eriantha TaxID=165200 RepID=UPI00258F9C86|nr:probable sodium/metabolite cotransporter BASS4, chloroplastic isoform X2 [Actinidia eriantha]